jgi:hypothetical protein
MNSAVQQRLSPSGPVIGNPPQLTGGNSSVPGRVWVAQGVGSATPIPGAAAGDMLGLEAVVVDLKPGYSYDVELDTQTFGSITTGYDLIVLGSHDGGTTYPDTLCQIPDSIKKTGCGRLQVTNVSNPNAAAIDHVKCQIKSLDASTGGVTYSPTASALRITETSPAVIL